MQRYSLLLRLMHWPIALVVLATVAGGLTIGILGFKGVTETFGKDGRDLIYEYHKTLGLIVLGLMLIRLFVRLEHGKPPRYDISPAERAISSLVQYLLYIFLLAQPIIGWLATDAASFPVEFFHWNIPDVLPRSKEMKAFGMTLYEIHSILGWTTVVLLVLHIGGALKHWIFDRNRVMWRMGFFGRRREEEDGWY